MIILEWILVGLLIVIAGVGVLWLLAMIVGRVTPTDRFYRTIRALWTTLLDPAELIGPMKVPSSFHDTTFVAEVKVEAPGPYVPQMVSVELEVTVNAQAESDRIIDVAAAGVRRHVTIDITTPINAGITNQRVMALLAEALEIKPHQLTLTRGHYEPFKLIRVTGMREGELEKKLKVMS